VALTATQFAALCARLDTASKALRASGSHFQSIARRYYLVYAYAAKAAVKHGVSIQHRRGKQEVETEVFTHQALPDVIYALYTGNRRSNVSPGSTPGVIGGRLSDREAISYANALQKDRKLADYGPTDEIEPYTEEEANKRVRWADLLVEDLRTLL